MAITLINATQPSGTIDPADTAADMQTIQTALNSLDGANLQAGSVAASALVNSEAEFHLAFDGILGSSITTVFLPLNVSGDIIVKGAQYYMSDNGTGAGSVTVTRGTISGGTYSSNGTLVNVAIPGGSNQAAAGSLSASGTIDSNDDVLRLVFTRGTGQNSNATDFFRLSLRCVSALTT